MADISVTLPRDTGHQAVVKFAAATGPLRLLAAALLEPSLFGTRQLSGSYDFHSWLLVIDP